MKLYLWKIVVMNDRIYGKVGVESTDKIETSQFLGCFEMVPTNTPCTLFSCNVYRWPKLIHYILLDL